ncbi:MAG: copper-translocating P-type ATPase [Rhodospirillaceae bacterium]|nr:copper-translocating P-type ATPase [Rhodospirillaceae bacterium]
MTVQTVFRVEGMTCAGCVARVESAISEIPGVEDAAVNLATGSASIKYYEDQATEAGFRKAIEAAGYCVGEPDDANASHKNENSGLRRDVIIAVLLSAVLLAISKVQMFPPVAAAMFGLLSKPVWGFFELALATPVVFYTGWRFIRSGLIELRHLNPGMNSLVMIGAGAAYFYSVVVLFWPRIFTQGTDQSYFVAAGIIVTLILVGRYLEALARGQTSRAISALVDLEPQTARVVKNSTEAEIFLEELCIGDTLVVRPGERLAADGIVLTGTSQIDEAMITGEWVPVDKSAGAKVIAGTINKAGAFTYRATSIGEDTVLRQIVQLVEQAQNDKPPIQRLSDKIASIFVPAVMLLSVITFAIWMIIGAESGFAFAFVTAVSVLLIACPCAMGLATPTAIMVGTGRGAENGILIRNGSALESLAQIDTVIFDKTGTLTQGMPKLSDILDPVSGESLNKDDNVLELIAAAEAQSEHPVSRAIVEAAIKKDLVLPAASEFSVSPGLGIEALIEGKHIQVGSAQFMAQEKIEIGLALGLAASLAKKGKIVVMAAIDSKLVAVLGITDSVKPEVPQTLSEIETIGLQVGLITGDGKLTADFVASELGISQITSETLPDDKASEIIRLQKEGRKIAFVGDGINDAPALAVADVGIALGTGTDIAVQAGDVVLMAGDVRGVLKAIALARSVLRTIQFNLFWAYGYNIVLIPVAAGMFFPLFGWLLNPILAAAAMSLSSLFVVINSLRLRRLQLPFSL